MNEVVIDASVALHWFTNEDDSPAARVLLDDCISDELRLVVPDLLFIEVANAISSQEGASPKLLEKVVTGLWGLKLEVAPLSDALLKEACWLAHSTKITLYDAIYVALARERGCELITADQQIMKRVRKADIENIRALWE